MPRGPASVGLAARPAGARDQGTAFRYELPTEAHSPGPVESGFHGRTLTPAVQLPVPRASELEPGNDGAMKITYDTVTDSISSDELDAEQTRALQTQLSSALARNLPVRDVATLIMSAVRSS